MTKVYRPDIVNPSNCIDLEAVKYEKSRKLIAFNKFKWDEIHDIKQYITKFRIPIFKYNHSLDSETQNHVSFQSFI